MRSSRIPALALAAAGLTLALAAAAQAQTQTQTEASGGQAPITVHRGAQVTTVQNGVESQPTAPAEVQGVTVARGHGPAAPAQSSQMVAGQMVTRGVPLQATGGEVVWLLDADDGRLMACELVETANYGASKIRCRSRDLPR